MAYGIPGLFLIEAADLLVALPGADHGAVQPGVVVTTVLLHSLVTHE